MVFRDSFGFMMKSVVSHRLRSALTALGIGIGVTAVVLLTSVGEGLQAYMLNQFTQFGTNIIAVQPGKATTLGTSLGALGTVRPLTIEDGEALRRVPYVTAVTPMLQGNASVEGGGRERRTMIVGANHDAGTMFGGSAQFGTVLPDDDPIRPRAMAVLCNKLATELFDDRNPVGERVRIGGDRYRVVGVMAPQGSFLGMDLDDCVLIPAARAMQMFNKSSLMEIDVKYAEDGPLDEVVEGIRRTLIARHGVDDVTILSQQQMLDVLGSVLGVITFAVGALGGISLLVGGVGIFTIMTIAVRERTNEVGLLRAVGARRGQVAAIFLGESVLLGAVGGIAGLLTGATLVLVMGELMSGLPVKFSVPFIIAAEAVAVVIGLIAGVLPARRAAAMDPVEALRAD